VVVDLDPTRAETVAEMTRRIGRRSVAIPADILDDAQAATLCDRAEVALGGLDILVCVVGASKFGGILELSADEWDRDHARNLRYFFLCTQAAARSFIRRRIAGSIVGIATGGAFGSMPFRSPYGAARRG
jgi:NAD(P)-dependent dehydrogenase (short-subunit alcohol dehydrogenase family)